MVASLGFKSLLMGELDGLLVGEVEGAKMVGEVDGLLVGEVEGAKVGLLVGAKVWPIATLTKDKTTKFRNLIFMIT